LGEGDPAGELFVELEWETGIEPATFSLGSGIGPVFSETYPALFEINEPIETAICEAAEKFGPNLDQGFRGFPIVHLAHLPPWNGQI